MEKFCDHHIKYGNSKNCEIVKQFWKWVFEICNKKWHVIDSETAGAYSENESIKFVTRSIESSPCDYSDAYILATGNITSRGNDSKAAFKNCAPFRTCIIQINETFVDEAKHINITMPMYISIEYSDNYSDTSGSLWHFNREEQPK